MKNLLARVPGGVLWDRNGALADWCVERGYPRPLLIDVERERARRRGGPQQRKEAL